MGVGVERFQHHLLGSKQEEVQRAADLGEGASWWNSLIKASPNGHRCSSPPPPPDPSVAHTPLAVAMLPRGGAVEGRAPDRRQT